MACEKQTSMEQDKFSLDKADTDVFAREPNYWWILEKSSPVYPTAVGT
jgi:hypothetical protein